MKNLFALLICLSIAFTTISCNNTTIESNSSSLNSKMSTSVSMSVQSSNEVITIEVGTIEELFSAIASNRIIKLKAGIYRLDELTKSSIKNPYASIKSTGEEFGEEFIIHDVQNLSIIGLGDKQVEVFTKFVNADVLSFEDSSDISLSNLRIGHAPDLGGCYGGVLFFKDSSNVKIDRCNLFGCGISGLETRSVKNLLFKDSTIEECKLLIMSIGNSDTVHFQNSHFINNRGNTLINITGSTDVLFSKSTIADNHGVADGGVLFAVDCGYSPYVSEFDWNNVISEILIKDSTIKENWTVSPKISQTANGSENSLKFENVVFSGNSFD